MQEVPTSTFRSNWVKCNHDPRSDRKKRFSSMRSEIVIVFDVGSKSAYCGDFLQLVGPSEKRETTLDKYWRKDRIILRRERPISYISGQKLVRAYVMPKGTFSIVCKSDCITITTYCSLAAACDARYMIFRSRPRQLQEGRRLLIPTVSTAFRLDTAARPTPEMIRGHTEGVLTCLLNGP